MQYVCTAFVAASWRWRHRLRLDEAVISSRGVVQRFSRGLCESRNHLPSLPLRPLPTRVAKSSISALHVAHRWEARTQQVQCCPNESIRTSRTTFQVSRLWFCIWANFFLLHFTKYLRLRAEVATRATHIQYGMCFIFVLKSTISGAEPQNFLRPRRGGRGHTKVRKSCFHTIT